MKTQVTIESHLCDRCAVEERYPDTCTRCGAEFCESCSREFMHRYHVEPCVSSSTDPRYCLDCSTDLRRSGKDPLFNALEVQEQEIERARIREQKSRDKIEQGAKLIRELLQKKMKKLELT